MTLEIHLPSFHEFPPDTLQIPRSTFLQGITGNGSKISIPDTVYVILILPVTLAPLTGFHASKRRDIGLRHENLSSLAKCSVISNHPIERFSFECRKVIGLKDWRHFFIQSEVKPKPIVSLLAALCVSYM